MPRSARHTLGDGFFHVTARGNGRAAIFLDDYDYRAFLRLLANVTGRCGWRLHAYCLMPNHFHLVVDSTGETLSNGMRALNGGYAQYFNSRYNRSGHVFQGRYDARLIGGDAHFADVCRYVVENPVRTGMCERAEDYPWSALYREA